MLSAFSFWRGAGNLQGHAKAAAQAIAEALAMQTRDGRADVEKSPLEEVNRLILGLGSPVPMRLDETSPAVGKTLAELNIRGLTGATVLAIRRGAEAVLVPSGHELLKAGDVLGVAGTRDAVEAARRLLVDGSTETRVIGRLVRCGRVQVRAGIIVNDVTFLKFLPLETGAASRLPMNTLNPSKERRVSDAMPAIPQRCRDQLVPGISVALRRLRPTCAPSKAARREAELERFLEHERMIRNETPGCPACGGKNVAKMDERIDDAGSFLASELAKPQVTVIYRCECGLSFTKPKPSGDGR